MTGIFQGPELPAGPAPFFLLGGICGVAGVFVWAPWNAARRAVEHQEIADAEPDESADPGNIDLCSSIYENVRHVTNVTTFIERSARSYKVSH